MKKRRLVTVLFVLALAVFTSIVAVAESDAKIGVVNINRVISESNAGQKADATLVSLIETKQQELNQASEEIVKLKEELDKMGEEDEQKKKKQAELNQAVSNYQQRVNEVNAEIQNTAQNLRNQLVKEIRVIINTIGEEENYALIFDAATVTYHTRVNIIDITGEVVRRYNQSQIN